MMKLYLQCLEVGAGKGVFIYVGGWKSQVPGRSHEAQALGRSKLGQHRGEHLMGDRAFEHSLED